MARLKQAAAIRRHNVVKLATEAWPLSQNQSLDEQIEVLENLIAKPPARSRLLTIGPELAEHILTTRNLSNRPMKPFKIKEYADDLVNGRWGVTGDTIKFGKDGQLKDGQNRLAAIVRAQKPMTTHAVFGVSPDLFARMDVGKVRSPGDVFHIAGLHYPAQSAAAVRWLLIFNSNNPNNRGAHFTNDELLRAYREVFKPVEVEQSVRLAMEVKKNTGAPVGTVAALHYLFSIEDPDKADQFMTEWASGSGGKNAPVRVLQRKLASEAAATNNRVHENVRNHYIITAWNAYKAGKTLSVRSLKADPMEPIPDLPRVKVPEELRPAA